MKTRRPPRAAVAYAAGKVNIGWRVGDRRPDGYHEVCGLIHTISLADELSFRTGDDAHGGAAIDVAPGVQLHLRVNDETLQTDDNLVAAAARAMAEETEPMPTAVDVRKVIPVAAGLGGGSADAAATLVALNVLWGARLSAERLIGVGASIGSDVPALLVGGLVHVSGRGERVRRVGAATDGAFVLGVGPEHVRAADAYEAFDRVGGASGTALHANDLEPAVCSLVPALAERLAALRTALPVSFVTGSGPTLVGVTGNPDEARRVAARGIDGFREVVVAHPVDWGVRLKVGAQPGS